MRDFVKQSPQDAQDGTSIESANPSSLAKKHLNKVNFQCRPRPNGFIDSTIILAKILVRCFFFESPDSVRHFVLIFVGSGYSAWRGLQGYEKSMVVRGVDKPVSPVEFEASHRDMDGLKNISNPDAMLYIES